MKRLMMWLELTIFRRAYSASQVDQHRDPRVSSLSGFTLPVPFEGWAYRTATRRQERSGATWTVTKWRHP